jgi:nanoRNase/pAp phosphatase (c-di-AMP/oligoRNAs hydrolase)
MELTSEQQIFDLLRKSNKILIVLPEILTADSLGAGLALRLFLSRMQKDVSVASSGALPESLKFLPGAEFLQNQVSGGKSLVISVDTSVKKMEEVSYQTSGEKVNIYLKSKNAQFGPEDLSFSAEKSPVDLIFCLGAKSLEDLGSLHEQTADLFFETPKINIDNKPANEYFGQVNLVDVTASSVAEVLAEVLQKYEEQLLDQDIATCLLAGIIAQTNSFQHVQTTPKAFLKASELISLGGRQQEIVKNIFKTKSLSLLKLWGRALARMKTHNEAAYSLLNFADFEKAGASVEDLPAVLKEFVDNTGSYKIIAILAETAKDTVKFLGALHEQIPTEKFLESLGGGKVLDSKVGNYKIVESAGLQMQLETLENKFLQAVKI